jgi:hypothetical protein
MILILPGVHTPIVLSPGIILLSLLVAVVALLFAVRPSALSSASKSFDKTQN